MSPTGPNRPRIGHSALRLTCSWWPHDPPACLPAHREHPPTPQKVSDLLTGAKFAPCGPVSGHDRLKHCSSLPDLIGLHLLVEYCGRHDLAHVPGAAEVDGSPCFREGEVNNTSLSVPAVVDVCSHAVLLLCGICDDTPLRKITRSAQLF